MRCVLTFWSMIFNFNANIHFLGQFALRHSIKNTWLKCCMLRKGKCQDDESSGDVFSRINIDFLNTLHCQCHVSSCSITSFKFLRPMLKKSSLTLFFVDTMIGCYLLYLCMYLHDKKCLSINLTMMVTWRMTALI